MNSPSHKKLTVGCPNLGNRALFDQYVNDAFERRWFTNNGINVQKLEEKIADHLQVKHCIAVCNATVGLQIAAMVLELTGEVIVPSFTFIATPHSLQWQGITPRFVDIDPSTHLLDPTKVEAAITERTSAILAVHTWGQACYPEQLQAIADKHNLKLYFDAAHAFSCSHGEKMIGNFGNCEVFSFHATKFFNTFEGGAITTNDDELAKKIRLAINFGFTGLDQVESLGINGKMSEIHAAMGLASFDTLDDVISTNRSHHQLYHDLLSSYKGIKLMQYPSSSRSNFQYIVLEIDRNALGITRDEIINHLHNEDIIARRYFHPGCHKMEPYSNAQQYNLPHTDVLCGNVLILPNGTAISSKEVKHVCYTIQAMIPKL